jgi:uncharacterized membrane protein YfcA
MVAAVTPGLVVLVAASGFVAGAMNAVAGGGTLVAFPALLATGMTARMANIVSTIGLVPGYAGGSYAYREELAGQGTRVRALAATSLVGGVAGAVILLVTPASSFRAIVPYLILASCALLFVQPRLTKRVADRQRRAAGAGPGATSDITLQVQVGVFIAAVYGSYFGAGLGVLLLGILGILLAEGMQRLNALKGLLSLLINAVSVIVFVVNGEVAWWYTAILAVAAWAGGAAGVGVARRLSPRVLRAAVITLGVVVAVALIIKG